MGMKEKIMRQYVMSRDPNPYFPKGRQSITFTLGDDDFYPLYPEWEDQISGGLADKKKPSDFEDTQLMKGVKVELEHTSDLRIATEIAMDHLVEDPKYYDKLEIMESGGKQQTNNLLIYLIVVVVAGLILKSLSKHKN
jgi:hypothetical protein